MNEFFDEVLWPDVMIDLETMGKRPSAPIIAIGACSFNLQTLTLGERFYVNVDLQSSVANGAVVDPGTVIWWMEQSDQARQGVLRGQRLHINVAMQQFTEWLHKQAPKKEVQVWGCSPAFDCVILGEHYHRASLEVPWEFWNENDFRTIRKRWPNVEPDSRQGTHHNALDDAVFQTEHLFKIRRTLRGQA